MPDVGDVYYNSRDGVNVRAAKIVEIVVEDGQELYKLSTNDGQHGWTICPMNFGKLFAETPEEALNLFQQYPFGA